MVPRDSAEKGVPSAEKVKWVEKTGRGEFTQTARIQGSPNELNPFGGGSASRGEDATANVWGGGKVSTGPYKKSLTVGSRYPGEVQPLPRKKTTELTPRNKKAQPGRGKGARFEKES